MNFKVGDKVVVIAGKDKGKEGKIIKTLKNDNKVVVEGINMVTKHVNHQHKTKMEESLKLKLQFMHLML